MIGVLDIIDATTTKLIWDNIYLWQVIIKKRSK